MVAFLPRSQQQNHQVLGWNPSSHTFQYTDKNGVTKRGRSYIVCTPPFLQGGGGGVEPPTKFSERWFLTEPQLLQGVARKEGGNFFQGGVEIVT